MGSTLTSVGILGTGSYLPDRVVDNQELARRYGCSEEWILTRTGIRERRFAAPGTGASGLAVPAARRALEAAGVAPEEVGLLLCATYTPDMAFPATACRIQASLRAHRAAACDLQAACSGFVYALVLAAHYIAGGGARYALVVASDVNSTIVDPEDRKVSALFGDGAGAVVLGRVEEGAGLLAAELGADGRGGDLFHMPAGGSLRPASAETVARREHFIRMDGRSLFRFGVESMVAVSRAALRRAGLEVGDVDLFVPHQANLRIVRAGLERLGIPMERTAVVLDRFANTAAASIPLALDEAVRGGRVAAGHTVLLTGFGAGLTWGAVVLRWSSRACRAPHVDALEARR